MRTSTCSRPTRSSSGIRPPFELTRRDGKLYARGVADDKGNMFVLVEAARQLADEGALPVNVRFAFDGEEEIGGDSIVEWVDQDEGPADVALILDGAMVRRGQPGFMVGVRGMVYLHLRVRTGRTDMHSGMFGAAALNATHALMTALASVLPGADGRLPDELRVGAIPPTAEELEAWAQLPSGDEQLGLQGAAPIAPGAADEFYLRTFADTSLDVNGIASGSPDLVKTVLPVEARANVSMRLAPGQDPETVRAAFERRVRDALPAGAELEITLKNSARPALTPTDSAGDPTRLRRVRARRRRAAVSRAVRGDASDLREPRRARAPDGRHRVRHRERVQRPRAERERPRGRAGRRRRDHA